MTDLTLNTVSTFQHPRCKYRDNNVEVGDNALKTEFVQDDCGSKTSLMLDM